MSNEEVGLTNREAQERLAQFGPNALPAAKRDSFLVRLARQFRSALVYLLLLALTFDLAAWLYEGHNGFPVEAFAILAILLLNAGLGVLQEYRSEQALAELEKLGEPRIWVTRNGRLERIEATLLVPGDLVRLESGDRIPADGTALDTESLSVDESLLTGESLPVEKQTDDELSSGTLVLRGRSQLRVTRTGASSAMGRLAGALTGIESSKTPLERRIDALGTTIARCVAALSLVVIVSGLAVEGWARFSAVVMFAVALGVAVVPESMPAMMTLALAFGVQRMARRNAVVRRLSAVEALGSVTVIASDKTGTLTWNKITVEALHAPDEDQALLALALVNDADEELDAGDPLERGLIEFAQRRGTDVRALRHANPRVSSRPFDTRWKYMRATVAVGNGELRSYVKGAAEVVLSRCLLGPEALNEWRELAEREARRGFKVLGLATAKGASESALSFLGLVSLWDAPRPEAADAVRAAHDAGISVLMVTGDHPETARTIGERVGIAGERALTGAEIEAMSPAELGRAVAEVKIFSRMLPEHKLRVVEALQARGEVVAMTGDGLNDAPALKRADIGVAMGQRGSAVAREVADVVLLDDNFATIVAAVEEGRIIYENIMNFIRFTFSSNVALMLLVLGGAIGSWFLGLRTEDGALLLPLTALQILWINFLGDGPPALALAVDRCPNVMKERPRARHAALLDKRALKFIAIDGAFKGAIGLALLYLLPKVGLSLPETATAVFLYEAIAKLASAYPARKVGATPTTNVWLHLSVACGIALVFLCLLSAPLRNVLALSTFDATAVWYLLAATAVSTLSGELLARSLRTLEPATG